MTKFANPNYDASTFSPVFKPHKLGNVVNMGNINANNVLLIGNKVVLNTDIKDNKLNKINASNIHLVGNDIDIDLAGINKDSQLTLTAKNKGSMHLSATGYYYEPSLFNQFINYQTSTYKGLNANNEEITITHNNTNFKNDSFISLYSDVDWWHFAKGWNENKAGFRDTASEYRLINNIDFGGDKGKNYANYCIDGLGCTNMIIGWDVYYDDYYNSYIGDFDKNFNGQGYTLGNINIDTTNLTNKPRYVGIFGYIKGGEFKNINIDYKNGSIKAGEGDNYFSFLAYTGGFVGYADGGTFSNIVLNNIGGISTSNYSQSSFTDNHNVYTGGFVGYADSGTFDNIVLNNIGNISANGDDRNTISAGGFAGWIRNNAAFNNIVLNNIGSISSNQYAGGFAGDIDSGTFDNIVLNNIGNISANGDDIAIISAGSFAGWIRNNAAFDNIALNDIGSISANANIGRAYAGGFAGYASGTFSNISINSIGSISSNDYAGGFAGHASGTFSNISINSIGSINANGDYAFTGGFTGDIDGGTFTNISINNIGSISANANSGSAFAGGFAGHASGAFNNIVLNNIGNITSIGAGGDFDYTSTKSCAGGFAGDIGYGTFSNMALNNIGSISASGYNGSDYSSYAGGFAGYIKHGTFSNISINNIGSISANTNSGSAGAGGFAGYIEYGTFSNMALNNIGSISASESYSVNAGGFAGGIGSGTFNNIVLNNIGSITSSTNSDFDSSNAGGFAGEIYGGTFENIVLNNIGRISTTSNFGSWAGGFAGEIEKGDFTNIYVYFNPEAIIKGDGNKGIFVGSVGSEYNTPTTLTLDNINLYYTNSQFNGIENIGNKEDDVIINGEEEISKAGIDYKEFRDDVFRAFSRQEGLVEIDCGNGKKCLSFASDFEVTPPNVTPPSITSPSIPDINTDPDVSDNIALEADDLYLDTIQKEILAHLYLAYNIDLNQLTLILDKLSSLNDEASKIDFLTKYLLKSKDENEAKNLLASLNFLNVYKDNGLNINSNFKDNNAKDTYLKIASDFKTIEDNKNNFRSFIEKRLQELNTIKDNTNSLDNKKAELEKLVKAYNDFVKLINDGSYSKDSQEFITLTKKLSDLSKEIISLEQSINDDIAKLASHQFNKENGTSLSFANMPNKVNISFPILDAINNNGTNPEIPDRPDRPVEPIYPEDVNKPDQLFSQVSVLDDNEDEEANIDEAATEQRLKTCIVNDNFKTMNPCVVEIM